MGKSSPSALSNYPFLRVFEIHQLHTSATEYKYEKVEALYLGFLHLNNGGGKATLFETNVPLSPRNFCIKANQME